MAVSISTVESLVIQELNANSSYTTSSSDPRFYTAGIADAALSADGLIIEAICRNLQHSRRAQFYVTQTGTTHGGTIGNALGPIDTVQFVVTGGTAPGNRAAKPWDDEEIQNEIANPLALTKIAPHYAIEGRVVYHNGSTIATNSGGGTVSVNVTYPAYSRTSACQAPDEYVYAVTCGTLALLFPVEGENVTAGHFYWAQFQIMLNQISTGEATIPQFRSIANIADNEAA